MEAHFVKEFPTFMESDTLFCDVKWEKVNIDIDWVSIWKDMVVTDIFRVTQESHRYYNEGKEDKTKPISKENLALK
jgi:hypothetical protein